MRALEVNSEARYQTVPNACKAVNVCRSTLMRLAGEANAIIRIGKSVRIDMPVLFEHIDAVYKCGE